jgi:hypothetical protein
MLDFAMRDPNGPLDSISKVGSLSSLDPPSAS